jgi:hypothetical protein
MLLIANEPTENEVDDAWEILRVAKINRVVNISLGELGRIAAGNPNYSPAEIRMARGILVLASLLVEKEKG